MKKGIPSRRKICEGIIGEGMVGSNYKTFISVIRGKYYTGYLAVREEMESPKPNQISEVKEVGSFKEALKIVIEDENNRALKFKAEMKEKVRFCGK